MFSVSCRRKPIRIRRIYSYRIVISEDISEYPGFDLGHPHSVCRDTVQEFLLQRSEEALHSGIVEAVINAAQTLPHVIACKKRSEIFACILAASVRMQDGTLDRVSHPRSLESIDTEFFLHVISHDERQDLSVEAVEDRRDVQLAVNTLDLRYICS